MEQDEAYRNEVMRLLGARERRSSKLPVYVEIDGKVVESEIDLDTAPFDIKAFDWGGSRPESVSF